MWLLLGLVLLLVLGLLALTLLLVGGVVVLIALPLLVLALALLLLLGNNGIYVHLLLAAAHALLLAVGLGLLLLFLALALALVLRFLLWTCALVQGRQVYVALYLQAAAGLLGSVQAEDTVLQSAGYLAIGNDLGFVGGGLCLLCGFCHRCFNGLFCLLLLLYGRFCLFLRSIQVDMTNNLQRLLLCLGLFFSLCLSLFFCLSLGFCFSLSLSLSFGLFLFLALLLLLLLLEHVVGSVLQYTVRFELLKEQVVLLV